MGISYGHRYFDAKFMCPFKVTGRASLHHGGDAVMLLQDLRDPPVECWFMVNAGSHSKFGSRDGVGLFQVREFLPGRRTILPLAA
jgi:hypothetical protein